MDGCGTFGSDSKAVSETAACRADSCGGHSRKPGGLFADDWFGMDQQSRLFSGEPVSGSADDGHRFWKRKTFQTDGGRALSGMFSHGRLSQVCRPVLSAEWHGGS